MRFTVETIPNEDQAYPTCGNWIAKRGRLSSVLVSREMGEDSAFAVGIHEAVEAWLCLRKGTDPKEVDAFDMSYEEARAAGTKAPCGCRPTRCSEPGSDRHAPYRKEHEFATVIEKTLISEMGMSWKEHERTIGEL